MKHISYLCSGLLSEVRSRYSYTKYTYSSSGLLEKVESYSDPNQYNYGGGYGSPYGYDYGNVKWTDLKGMKLDVTEMFKYSEKKQLESYSFMSSHADLTATVSYNEQGLLSQLTMYSEDSKPMSYADFFYDESGNVIKKSEYLILPDRTPVLRVIREYEFDKMHNPFLVYRKSIFPGRSTNQNNIIKETSTYYSERPAGTDSVTIANHVYEYNELGYPIKMDNKLTYEYN